MAFSDWFRFHSTLEMALKRGLQPGADLARELREIGDVNIKSAHEANAICDALERVRDSNGRMAGKLTTPLQALVVLFQSVSDPSCGAIPVLRDRGLPLLCELFDRGLADEKTSSSNDLLLVLKIFALYCSPEGMARIIRAARGELKADGFLWSVIFSAYTYDHPQTVEVFNALKDPLPQGFVAVALLDAANAACRAETSIEHPFDTAAGATRLRQWLVDSSEDRFSYARSAAAALPFLRHVPADALIKIALTHPHPPVRIETAWALARMNRREGIDGLARFALDVNYSSVARRYLEELGAADAMPAEASTPTFRARAAFAEWLAHPNELACPPDEVGIVDHRELCWPPDFTARPVWLLSGLVKKSNGLDDDECHVGMAGTRMFCLFGSDLHQRPPEDGYALHCTWEMESEGLLKIDDEEENMSDYASLLQTWRGPALSDARVVAVAEIDVKLRIRPGMLGIATAKLNGQPGWAILGDSSMQFYPADDLPEGDRAAQVLKIEIGRRVLGFPSAAARSEWLRPKQPRQAVEIVAAYERQIALFQAATPQEQFDKLKMGSVLARHFERYIHSLAATRGGKRTELMVPVYEAFFTAAKAMPTTDKDEVFDSFSLLGEQFEHYVDGLLALERRHDVLLAIEFLSPKWQHNLGYGTLGKAAFKAGSLEQAEANFIKLREGMDAWFRCEEMPMLAQLWHARGEVERSKHLLLEALKAVLAESRETTGAERKIHEESFQRLRQSFLELIADGRSELVREKIPESLMG